MENLFSSLEIPQAWASAPNPLIDYCHRWSRDNALRWEVISNRKNIIERFNKQNFSLLTALAYPHADKQRIAIINDFILYLFLNDDIAEQEDVGKKLKKLVSIFMAHARAFREGVIDNPSDPLCAYIVDIRTRLLEIASNNWLHRFSKNVEEHLMRGTLVGAQNCIECTVPTIARYEEQRKYDSAVFACQDLIEISEGFELPNEIYYNNDIQKLKELSNLVVAYTNDIFSYHKEVNVFSSSNNIVHVVMIQDELTLIEAIERVTDIINDKVAMFGIVEKNLPNYWVESERNMVDLYIKGLKAWMRGNINWSFASKRYHSSNSPFEELRQGAFDISSHLTETSAWKV